jgi:hypothetical protein
MSMSPRDLMPGATNPGEDWDDARKSEIVGRVVAGALSIRDACDCYGLSPERIRDWVLVFRRSALQAFDDHLRETLVSQGLDADNLVAAGFTGTLDDIAISDLVQTMTMGRRDGVITVSHEGHQSRIWCATGAIVDAESGRLRGEHAVHRILGLDHGRIVAEFCSVSRSQSIQASTLTLLIDGARRKDECALMKQRLGDGLYRVAPKATDGSVVFSAAEAAVLRAFEVPRTLADVVTASDLGDLETWCAISELVQQECLVPGGQASFTSITQPERESFLIQASVLSVLPPAIAPRVDRAAFSGRFRIGLAAALCALGTAGGFLFPRLSSSWIGQTSAPAPPADHRPRVASSPLPVTDASPAAPADSRDSASSRSGEAFAPSLSLAAEPLTWTGKTSSESPSERGAPASATSRGGASENTQTRTRSIPSLPSDLAAPSEQPDQPRIRIIDEEKTPTMRILE